MAKLVLQGEIKYFQSIPYLIPWNAKKKKTWNTATAPTHVRKRECAATA